MPNAPWYVERKSPSVAVLEFDVTEVRQGRILLMADEHVDNQLCNRELLTKHHEQALETQSPIIKVGDIFCAMQGKWDKRSDTNQMRPEHRVSHYLDALTSTAAQYYAPYASSIAIVTPGNHEASILDRHQVHLVQNLAYQLRQEHKSPVADLTYVSFAYMRWRRRGPNGGYHSTTRTMLLHHGFGGGGPITRGLIDNNRMREQYDADIFVSGHIHRRNVDENVIVALNKEQKIVTRQQFMIRCSTYKEEHVTMEGFHAMSGRAGRPLGGYWLNWEIYADHHDYHLHLTPVPCSN
jgi:hypothetical protein